MSKQIALRNSTEQVTVDADKYDFLNRFIWQINDDNEVYTITKLLQVSAQDGQKPIFAEELMKVMVYYFEKYQEQCGILFETATPEDISVYEDQQRIIGLAVDKDTKQPVPIQVLPKKESHNYMTLDIDELSEAEKKFQLLSDAYHKAQQEKKL